MSKINLIQIHVTGPVGAGKTDVMSVIEKALKEAYGIHTQVTSFELSLERNLTGETFTKPDVAKTIFDISEDKANGRGGAA